MKECKKVNLKERRCVAMKVVVLIFLMWCFPLGAIDFTFGEKGSFNPSCCVMKEIELEPIEGQVIEYVGPSIFSNNAGDGFNVEKKGEEFISQIPFVDTILTKEEANNILNDILNLVPQDNQVIREQINSALEWLQGLPADAKVGLNFDIFGNKVNLDIYAFQGEIGHENYKLLGVYNFTLDLSNDLATEISQEIEKLASQREELSDEEVKSYLLNIWDQMIASQDVELFSLAKLTEKQRETFLLKADQEIVKDIFQGNVPENFAYELLVNNILHCVDTLTESGKIERIVEIINPLTGEVLASYRITLEEKMISPRGEFEI